MASYDSILALAGIMVMGKRAHYEYAIRREELFVKLSIVSEFPVRMLEQTSLRFKSNEQLEKFLNRLCTGEAWQATIPF